MLNGKECCIKTIYAWAVERINKYYSNEPT